MDAGAPEPILRPASPAESVASNSTSVSTYIDAPSDTTIAPVPEPTETSESPLTASSSSLQESNFTIVRPPSPPLATESTPPAQPPPPVHITSPGGGKRQLSSEEERNEPMNNAAAGPSHSSGGLVPPPRTKRVKISKSKASGPQPAPQEVSALHFPEEGWDEDTPQNAVVKQYKGGEVHDINVASTNRNTESQLRHPVGREWSFCKLHGEGSFIASGRIHIPPKAIKEYKTTKDNAYVFFVIEGAVSVKIHESHLVLVQGGSFMIPRGNGYSIENISIRTAKLHFVQARELLAQEFEDPLRLASLSSSQSNQPNSPRPSRPSFLSSKVVILLSFLLEKLIKRFAKYRKILQKVYVKCAMEVARRVKTGPKAYLAFFFLGFLIRGIGFRRSFVPNVRVIVGGSAGGGSVRRD
ncbi:centromeric dna binding protein [Moniliophthora roreri MCA 2997]|uniref:Centromeric dna binding protein n=2 Tax=Moniliophthora roreri TaxID=221103 RepID=V2XXB0_MONRO|nr:centromeric dna binding protein [Moniliophthora roreri MCA 2997]